MFIYLIVFMASFISVMLFTPFFIKIGRKINLVGVDIHKPHRPIIPKTGGIVLIIGIFSSLAIYIFLEGLSLDVLALTCSSAIAWIIGLIEDLKVEINPKAKPIFLLSAGIPILLFSTYSPRPELPFIGATRLTKIYPVLAIASFPIVCNAVNSIDVLNGSISFTSIAFFTAIFIISLLHQSEFPLLVSVIMLASLTAFTIYNRYPARIFAGNSGSLLIGAVMASTAIIGRVEVAAIIALLPHIMNEMHVIFSMRGLKSAKNYDSRPIIIQDGMISANSDHKAPLTLVRILSANIKAREDNLVKSISILSFYSAFLAVLTDLAFMR
ncbi:MAG: hypothetical protein ABDH32_05370 [Candidatus Caldarchaeales archaeon]